MRLAILTVLSLHCWAYGLGQQDFVAMEASERLFQRGLAAFSSRDYVGASSLFDQVLMDQGINQRTTAAYVMSAKARIHASDVSGAILRLEEFLVRFPQSSYRADAYYTRSLIRVLDGKPTEAGADLIHCLGEHPDSVLAVHAVSRLDALTITHPAMISSLSRMEWRGRPKDIVAILLAEQSVSAGDISNARNYIGSMSDPNLPVFRERIRALREKLDRGTSLAIGALLPLGRAGGMNGASRIAEEILQGMQIATDDFNTLNPDSRVHLEVRDTGRDSAAVRGELSALGSRQDVIATVGPLFSPYVSSCAPIADAIHMPLISPTATAIGLARQSPYIFQANPDFAVRGRALARFMVKELGLMKLAILSSGEAGSRAIADSFAAEIQRLGATIIADATYPQGAGDLREQLLQLRSAALAADPHVYFTERIRRPTMQALLQSGATRQAIDSATASGGSIHVSRLFGPEGLRLADSLHLNIVHPDTGGAKKEIAVTSIDGVFASIAGPDDISTVASQLAFFNIRTRLFGSNEWYDVSELEANKRYLNGVIFFSDYFADKGDSAYLRFDQRYRLSYSRTPTRYTIYGYDAVRVILDGIQHGARTREALASRLRALQSYPGLHLPITFAGSRVNPHIHILQYLDGIILKIGEQTGN